MSDPRQRGYMQKEIDTRGIQKRRDEYGNRGRPFADLIARLGGLLGAAEPLDALGMLNLYDSWMENKWPGSQVVEGLGPTSNLGSFRDWMGATGGLKGRGAKKYRPKSDEEWALFERVVRDRVPPE